MVCIAGWKMLFYEAEVLEVVHGYLHINMHDQSQVLRSSRRGKLKVRMVRMLFLFLNFFNDSVVNSSSFAKLNRF